MENQIEKHQRKEGVQLFVNKELELEVRAVEINGEGWLVGKDIAEVLGYSNSSDALRTHVDEEDKKQIAYYDLQKLGLNDFGTKGGVLINESGFYSLILRSDMPKAKKFKRWVTSEVLPSIRKTGSYQSKPMSPMELLQLQYQVIQDHDKRLEEVDEKLEVLNNSMTIDYSQQEVIHRIAKERVVVVLGGKDTPAYREISKKVFSNLWKRYKQVFHVASYKDTAKKDFEEAIKYIEKWEPSKELGYMITGANSQIQFNN